MPLSLAATLTVADPDALALASLRTYPVTEPDAFEAACDALGCRPDLSETLAAARARKLLHACIRSYRPAIERDDRASAWLEVELVAAKVLRQQRRDLVALVDAAERSGLDFALPKGLAFALDLYADQPVLMGDIDVVVRARDRAAAAALLTSLGFRRGLALEDGALLRASARTVAEVEASVAHFGELHPFSRVHRFPELEPHRAFIGERLASSFVVSEQGIYCLRAIDVHYSLNPLTDHDPAGGRLPERYWWDSQRTLACDGREVAVLGDDVLAVTLPYRVYHELSCQGGTSLKPVSDLLALLRTRGIDFDRLLATAAAHPVVRPALYHVYRFLDVFCAAAIPHEVLDALAVPSDGSFYADWGDVWPRLVGARPAFEQLPTPGWSARRRS